MASTMRQANGLNRPRYFDRQLLNADDLTLEQGYSDQLLALLARHTLGWGVASGLFLTIRANGPRSDLAVGGGFGLTPLGDHVYLPQEVSFEDIPAALAAACGQGHDCTDLTLPPAAVGTQTSAWIIARPAALDGSPRPAFPEGCGNPGNNLKPSRTCGGVSIEIACTLTPPHLSQLEDPVAIDCGPWGSALPAPVADAANYVVLGAVEARPEGVFALPLQRRLIGRLDRAGRVACACQTLPTRYVTHIRPDQADADRRIDQIAGFDPAGVFFIETLDQAIAAIEGGARYFTMTPDRNTQPIQVRARRKRKYLRTGDDATTIDNLLSLPQLKAT
jgi:hypothetical protein